MKYLLTLVFFAFSIVGLQAQEKDTHTVNDLSIETFQSQDLDAMSPTWCLHVKPR